MTARFGAYEVVHALKSGGMGDVLLGRRRGPGAFEQLVAIKTIRPEYAASEAVRAMFLDEAAILARLAHPAIATVHDFGETDGALYMVMEYVAGIPFRDLAKLSPPPAIAASAIAEACRGVHAAHELREHGGGLLGVVHRDISPENLMLGFDGHVKVIDFGIALVRNRQSPVTELGMLKGKPPYMSPEQITNAALDGRSDVFSLAVVLHELVTGEHLFEGDSIYAVAQAVMHQAIPLPSSRISDLPPGFDAAVMAGLERSLDRRVASAAAFAESLEQVARATGSETLEAWSARALADARDQHRAWLAAILGGQRLPMGRATGALTPVAEPAMPFAPTKVPVAPAPKVSVTDLEAPTVPEEPRRRHAGPIIGLVVALGIVVAVVAFVLTRGSDGPVPVDAPIAQLAIDAAIAVPDVVIARLEIDAGLVVVDAPEVDAQGPDARVDRRRDEPRPKPDAATPAVTPPEPPVGEPGNLEVRTRRGGSYLLIMLDGKLRGPTPAKLKQIPPGRHSIQLLNPETNDVVWETTISLEAGESKLVQQP